MHLIIHLNDLETDANDILATVGGQKRCVGLTPQHFSATHRLDLYGAAFSPLVLAAVLLAKFWQVNLSLKSASTETTYYLTLLLTRAKKLKTLLLGLES